MLLKSPMCKSCIHLENLVMLERVGGLRRGLLLVNGYNLHSSIQRQSWLHQNSWYRLWKKSVCHWEPGMIVVVVFHQLLLLLSMLWRRQNRSRFSLRYCILINVRIDYTFWCAPDCMSGAHHEKKWQKIKCQFASIGNLFRWNVIYIWEYYWSWNKHN